MNRPMSAGKVRREKGFFGKLMGQKQLMLMSVPILLYVLLFNYAPMWGWITAFMKYNPKNKHLFDNAWVGLDNFKFLKSPATATMIRNTLCYNAVWILLVLVIAVSFAVMMSELKNRWMAKFYQTAMFFPYFLSWVVASYFVLAFLDPTSGMIPSIQKSLGMKQTQFYMTTTWWPLILTLANLWKNVGYSSVLYLAAITGIDTTLYEAAAVDGANKWQQVWHVTLPGIRPMIVILLIMSVGRIFNADFGLFYNVPQNSGPLYPVTQVIDTYVYNTYANTHNMGMSAAAGLMQSTVGCLCIVATNLIVRRIDPESSLF